MSVMQSAGAGASGNDAYPGINAHETHSAPKLSHDHALDALFGMACLVSLA